MVAVHDFSYVLACPLLGYAVSCLGSFLGLGCLARARLRQGRSRARWLLTAATAIGAGTWAMHFVAMLGVTIPGQRITYDVPLAIGSLLLVIGVVAVGLFIVGFGPGDPRLLLVAGLVVGLGVATMHYLGLAALTGPGVVSYNAPLFALSVVIAIVAGTAVLWAGLRAQGPRAAAVASLVIGAVVSGTHYTVLAAVRVYARVTDGPPGTAGVGAETFLLPLVLGIAVITFVLAVMISLSPNEDELREDAEITSRLDSLRQRD